MTPPPSSESESQGAIQGDASTALKIVEASAASAEAPAPATGTPEAPQRADADARGAVSEVAPSAPPGEAPAEESREGGRRGVPIWLFLVVFALFALALAWQVREGRRLEAEVAGLEQELGQTRALLHAHRGHLSEIRTGIHELADRFEGLRALVDNAPGDRPAGAARRGPAAPGAARGAVLPSEDASRSIPARLPER